MSTDDLILRVAQPHVPMSQNDANSYMRSPKGGKYRVSRERDDWKSNAFYAWKEQRFGPVGAVLGQPAVVTLHLGFHLNRTRDPHNYVGTVCKWVVDGLVLARVWPDDNPEWVKVNEPVLVVHERVPEETALVAEVHFELI